LIYLSTGSQQAPDEVRAQTKDIGVEWPATPVTRQYVEAINYRF